MESMSEAERYEQGMLSRELPEYIARLIIEAQVLEKGE